MGDWSERLGDRGAVGFSSNRLAAAVVEAIRSVGAAAGETRRPQSRGPVGRRPIGCGRSTTAAPFMPTSRSRARGPCGLHRRTGGAGSAPGSERSRVGWSTAPRRGGGSVRATPGGARGQWTRGSARPGRRVARAIAPRPATLAGDLQQLPQRSTGAVAFGPERVSQRPSRPSSAEAADRAECCVRATVCRLGHCEVQAIEAPTGIDGPTTRQVDGALRTSDGASRSGLGRRRDKSPVRARSEPSGWRR